MRRGNGHGAGAQWAPPGGWDHEKYEVNPMFLTDGAPPAPGRWDEAEMQQVEAEERESAAEDDEYEGSLAAREERRATTSMNHASAALWSERGAAPEQPVPLVFRRGERIEIALVAGAQARQCVSRQTPSKEGNEARIDAERQGRLRREIGDAIERAASQAAQAAQIGEVQVAMRKEGTTPALRRAAASGPHAHTAGVPALTWREGARALETTSVQQAFECLTRLVLDFKERRGWVDAGDTVHARWVLDPVREAWCVLKVGNAGEEREKDEGTFSEMMTPRERRNDKVRRVVRGEVNRHGQHYKRADGGHVDLSKGIRVGELLQEERLVPRGMTQSVLAQAMNVPVAALKAVIEGIEPMSAAMSVRLGRALGDPDQYWYDAEKACQFENLRQVRAQIEGEVRAAQGVLARVKSHPEYRGPKAGASTCARRETRAKLLGEGKDPSAPACASAEGNGAARAATAPDAKAPGPRTVPSNGQTGKSKARRGGRGGRGGRGERGGRRRRGQRRISA